MKKLIFILLLFTLASCWTSCTTDECRIEELKLRQIQANKPSLLDIQTNNCIEKGLDPLLEIEYGGAYSPDTRNILCK